MGTYKTNWQLTETVMPEDMNRIEENTKENNNALSEFKKQYNADSKEENKKIDRKAEKEDVILKVPYPEDRDCNSFKTLNAFCAFDTGLGDFKNTPEGTLTQGSARVFLLKNIGYNLGRFQQEFINLYPEDRITKYTRNYIYETNSWGNWYKNYDSANKPTLDELGTYSKEIIDIRTKILDTRNDNQNPNWYIQTYPYQVVNEFKISRAIGIPNGGALFGVLETKIPWNNTSGGFPVQTFKSNSYPTYKRHGISDTEWSEWVKVYDENNRPTPRDIGAIAQTPPRLTQDLNAATTPGLYVVDRASHAPQSYGRLLVLAWDNSQKWVTQVFFSDITNKIYTRCVTNLEGPVWTSWSEVYSTNFKPTPQDIGALPTSGGQMTGHLIMNPGVKFVGAHNYGYSCRTKEGNDDYVIYIDSDNKVHIGYNGRPVKIDSVDIVNKNNKKIYHEDNKPTPADIGAKPNEPTTFMLQPNYVAVRTKNRKPEQYYEFWDNEAGWADIKCRNVYAGDGKYQVYHQGFKPTPQDIGAAQTDHNHDSAYLGKTATAVDSNKLRGWLLAEASTKYRGVPFVSHDGVMELGHMLDFHLPNSNADFDSRLEAGNGVLTMWGDFVATNQYIKKYLKIKDWYDGGQDAKLWYKQQNKGLYMDDVLDLFVGGKNVALGKWESTGGADIYLLGGTLRLVRQVITTGVANSGGGVSYTIHFPKAWSWVQPISLVSDNMGDANTYTSGYCTIDAWSNSHLNGGCYQMVAGKSTRITLTYLAGV
ncbi:pyocin knob domain-containing protein [Clostridium perfringens]|uniref:pyocin knob domain-containing protein n=1 Tax=Clostridium perfringens TaxID=1502 RepID=UPI001240B907|nr:pyocin knob domain-containing protein [Clostridium perfringens]